MRFRPDIRELYVHVHVCCVFVFEYICIDSANAYENTIRISKTLTENHMNNTYHHTSTKLSIVGCDKIEIGYIYIYNEINDATIYSIKS